MKAIDKLREITGYFRGCGFESAEKEAEILMSQGLKITTVQIYRDNPELSKDHINTVEGMLARRLQHEPFQYITGYEEFMGLKLMVGPGVLIPRPETELMAEHAIKTVKRESLSVRGTSPCASPLTHIRVLDLCTGSGCLALAIAREFPYAKVYGSDISESAIRYAAKNAEINRIKNAVFLRGSLFQPFKRQFTADLIISNPPYVSTDDLKDLQPEVRDWEPAVALDGGRDGRAFYRELIPAAGEFLKDEGFIMLEIGAGQADGVADILKSSGYAGIKIIRDYSGIRRIVKASRATC